MVLVVVNAVKRGLCCLLQGSELGGFGHSCGSTAVDFVVSATQLRNQGAASELVIVNKGAISRLTTSSPPTQLLIKIMCVFLGCEFKELH